MSGTGDRKHDNNFDFFRLAAAAFVIFYHSFPLTGGDQYGIFGFLGVSIFFVISGYFITGSWFNRPSPYSFIWSRFLRLMPALAVLVLFTAFVIGPLTTVLTLPAYFTSFNTWRYLAGASLVVIPGSIPGVFLHNPLPISVNGSLWTLPLEARMYAVVLALGLIGIFKNKKRTAAIALVLLGLFIATNDLSGMFSPLLKINELLLAGAIVPNYTLPLCYCTMFMMGCTFYLYKDIIKYNPMIFAGASIIWVYSIFTPFLYTISVICLPYIILSLGFMKIPYLNMITKYGDFSYGIYIYAFPIQQTIVNFMPSISPWELFAVSLPVTLFFAVLSWVFIESRALALKKMNPELAIKKLLQPVAVVVRVPGRPIIKK